uniref:Uncharacterized protein LOC111129746 n=1 Tax=Crassostrea virginica TaxID=6565 RepID=A0A8B8DWC5_CRAVI|nr:uncharacterized protein LOC111129746 [Crassostrea virginica]
MKKHLATTVTMQRTLNRSRTKIKRCNQRNLLYFCPPIPVPKVAVTLVKIWRNLAPRKRMNLRLHRLLQRSRMRKNLALQVKDKKVSQLLGEAPKRKNATMVDVVAKLIESLFALIEKKQ